MISTQRDVLTPTVCLIIIGRPVPVTQSPNPAVGPNLASPPLTAHGASSGRRQQFRDPLAGPAALLRVPLVRRQPGQLLVQHAALVSERTDAAGQPPVISRHLPSLLVIARHHPSSLVIRHPSPVIARFVTRRPQPVRPMSCRITCSQLFEHDTTRSRSQLGSRGGVLVKLTCLNLGYLQFDECVTRLIFYCCICSQIPGQYVSPSLNILTY